MAKKSAQDQPDKTAEKKPKTIADIMAAYGLTVVKEYPPVKRLPSGSLQLDRALGGGWGVGHIQELWGEPSMGKSLQTMITMGRTLFNGLPVVLYDVERSFDKAWASNFMNVDDPNFVLVQRDRAATGEAMLNSIIDLSAMGKGLMVLDSKDAIVFGAELEGGVGKANMGKRSQHFTNFIRILSQVIGGSDITFIFVSQVRANFGNTYQPHTTSGGFALEHACSIQVAMNTLTPLKLKEGGKDVVVGKTLNAYVNKNKTAEARLHATVDVREFNTANGSLWAVDTASEVRDLGKELGLFTLQDGAPYTGNGNAYYKGDLLGTRDQALAKLREEVGLMAEIEAFIRQKMGWCL